MSSRVQKGNTVFRPVVVSRARTTGSAPSVSRQASVAIDQARYEGLSSHMPSVPPFTPVSQPEQSGSPTQELQPTPEAVFISPVPMERPRNVPVIRSSSFNASANPPAVFPTTIVTSARSSPAVPLLLETPPTRALNVESTPLFLPTPNEEHHLFSPLIQQATYSLIPQTPTSNAPADAYRSPGSGPATTSSAPIVLNPMNTLATSESQQQEGSSKGPRRQKSHDGGPKNAKKRRTSTGVGEEAVPERATSTESRSRSTSAVPRVRKRAPSPPPYDPDADPGEDIDPTTMTMAALCTDTGQGRVSSKAAEVLSNHTAWKVKNREKRARMKAMMEAKKYGKGEEEEGEEAYETEAQNEDLSGPSNSVVGPPTTSSAPAAMDDTGSGFDYSQGLATSRYNVQVRIGPNGETIIDEESLVVDRVDNDGTESYTHVTESDHTKFVNSGTYGKRYRGSRWSAEETELFYDALAQYGENYELIAYVLPGRDRKSCKNKFKVEDKKNHARINHHLNNSIPVDMKTLARMTGKDFSGPVPEIRAPPPPPMLLTIPEMQNSNAPEASTSKPTKKRSRSKSQGHGDGGVVVIGNSDTFES